MSDLSLPSLKCPACGRSDRTLFVCGACWQKVPAKDRQMLGTMRGRKQDTSSKLASVVRKLKEARA